MSRHGSTIAELLVVACVVGLGAVMLTGCSGSAGPNHEIAALNKAVAEQRAELSALHAIILSNEVYILETRSLRDLENEYCRQLSLAAIMLAKGNESGADGVMKKANALSEDIVLQVDKVENARNRTVELRAKLKAMKGE